jgi:hypothetical protein
MMKIKKIAYSNTDKDSIPEPKVMGMFIDVLKLHLKEKAENKETISTDIERLIRNLPSSKEINYEYSHEECRLVFETIRYLWKEIMGQDLEEEKDIETHMGKREGKRA